MMWYLLYICEQVVDAVIPATADGEPTVTINQTEQIEPVR